MPAALLSAEFEGIVHFKINTGKGSPQEISYSTKNSLVRIDILTINDSGPSVILDAVKKEMIVLLPAQKKYVAQSIAEPRSRLAKPDRTESVLEKTGGTEKIFGFECDRYVVKSEGYTTELWLTKQLGAFLGLGFASKSSGPLSTPVPGEAGSTNTNNANSWETLIAGKNLFPLRVITSHIPGQETSRLEATGFEKKPLIDSVFAPPDGWEKIDIGTMLRHLLIPPPASPARPINPGTSA